MCCLRNVTACSLYLHRALKTETSQHVLIADHMFSKLSNKDLKLAKAGAVQQLEVLEKESSTHFEFVLALVHSSPLIL